MSQQKRLSDYSLEELDVLLKYGRLGSSATGCKSSIATVREILTKDVLLSKAQLANKGEEQFSSDYAMFLLRQHPKLVTESFSGETVLSYFLRHGASSTATIQELCNMWKIYQSSR
ncbi:expressed unknown protein [Seminavis robusta]|uniref:Uncharacterized protein n=1 Tax=Seminavis robusta TaxID=568900 RepID=A0A9N8HN79_9STRA|nr:expressed unknown protein [Seminavis robusta]|eukprot:Sro968_g226050.1 n/a (116) ;mRNA; r:28951-29298